MICDVCGRVCSVIKMEMTRDPLVRRTYKCNNCGLGFDTVELRCEDLEKLNVKERDENGRRN